MSAEVTGSLPEGIPRSSEKSNAAGTVSAKYHSWPQRLSALLSHSAAKAMRHCPGSRMRPKPTLSWRACGCLLGDCGKTPQPAILPPQFWPILDCMEKASKSAKHPPFPSRIANLRFPRQGFVPIRFRPNPRMGYASDCRRGSSFYLPIQVRCTKCLIGLRSWLGSFQQGSSARPLLAISCFCLITNELSGKNGMPAAGPWNETALPARGH